MCGSLQLSCKKSCLVQLLTFLFFSLSLSGCMWNKVADKRGRQERKKWTVFWIACVILVAFLCKAKRERDAACKRRKKCYSIYNTILLLSLCVEQREHKISFMVASGMFHTHTNSDWVRENVRNLHKRSHYIYFFSDRCTTASSFFGKKVNEYHLIVCGNTHMFFCWTQTKIFFSFF